MSKKSSAGPVMVARVSYGSAMAKQVHDEEEGPMSGQQAGTSKVPDSTQTLHRAPRVSELPGYPALLSQS